MDDHQNMNALLDLDGVIIAQEGGYWVKFEVRRVDVSEQIPHGIRYSLTLHDDRNQRVMGYDNAHVHQAGRGGRRGAIMTYDHKHPFRARQAIPYAFHSPARLLEDFWISVDKCLKENGVI